MTQAMFESAYHPQEEVITRHQDLWKFVRARYLPEQQEITAQLDSGLAVILEAPFGTGKTLDIAGPLEQQYKQKGYSAVRFDSKSMGGVKGAFARFGRYWNVPNSEQPNRLAIVDEIPDMLFTDPQGTEEVLRLIKSKGAKLLAIDATRSPEQRTQVTDELQIMGQRAGIEFVVHHLRQTTIPEDLARKALVSRGADNDLIDFFLNPENVSLLNPRIFDICGLYQVRGIKTMDELRDIMLSIGVGTTIFPVPGFYTFLEKGAGGTKTDLVRMLINLGTITTNLEDLLIDCQLPDVPDY